MAKYFNYFPTTFYTNSNSSVTLETVTNIIARFSFEKALKENSSAFYPYDIQDGDTPEIIANKYYGSPEKHWIVLLFNDIVDPQFDWPMDQRTIIKFINDKYTSYGANSVPTKTGIAWAQTNIKSYYKVVTRVTNNVTKDTIKEKLEIDSNTYANVVSTSTTITLDDGTTLTETITKETESYYDYEINLNETKRKIQLLKPEYVAKNALMNELIRVLSE